MRLLSRGCLRIGRWLLPWISVLLVSASLAYAMNSTLSSALAIGVRQPHEIPPQPTFLPQPGALADGNDSQVVDASCVLVFGSYDWWLFSSGRTGPCGLEAAEIAGPLLDR
jgi:hypothetical protein